MAWRCSSATNDGLVAKLLQNGLVKTDPVATAMRRVDRALFLAPDSPREQCYEDAPQPIGYNVTISAPHMHAIMLEILAPYILNRAAQPQGEPLRVLDVGSGSGYLTAVLAALCEAGTPRWQVVGVEHVRQLQQRSAAVLAAHFSPWVTAGEVRIVEGDGRDPSAALASGGDPSGEATETTTFDLIHVGAAADSIPAPLVALLKEGGCMVIPVGPVHETQELLVCQKKAGGAVDITKDCLVSFVPLTSLAFQRANR